MPQTEKESENKYRHFGDFIIFWRVEHKLGSITPVLGPVSRLCNVTRKTNKQFSYASFRSDIFAVSIDEAESIKVPHLKFDIGKRQWYSR